MSDLKGCKVMTSYATSVVVVLPNRRQRLRVAVEADEMQRRLDGRLEPAGAGCPTRERSAPGSAG